MLKLMDKWTVGTMEVLFFEQDNIISMGMLPKGMQPMFQHRDNVDDSVAARSICSALNISFKAVSPESMLQLKLSGDAWFGHSAAGTSMRNAASCRKFKLKELTKNRNSCRLCFESEEGLQATQSLLYKDGTEYIQVQSTLRNGCSAPIRVEMFSAFSLGMISLLHDDDAPGALKLHRISSFWSSEARHQVATLEEMGMDMSWQAGGVRAIRFGQRSSSVNKEYSPLAAIEDNQHGVVWAAALEAMTPWQMEISRYSDFVNLSGSFPDREFDGWFVDLQPGETLESPTALLTVSQGSFEHAARKLLDYQRTAPSEPSLKPVFSDWCTSWGRVNEERLLKVAARAANLGVTYFSVDDGWFRRDTPGEWELNPSVFPQSFRHFADEIRSRFNLVAGIWFEFETVVRPDLPTYSRKDLLLTLDGHLIQSGERFFWDFRKPEVIAHLTRKVANFLKDNHIGYIKIDYNAPIPFGVDGPSPSPAANLINAQNAMAQFHRSLRQLVPHLRIEECASGGNRMTPGWIRMADFQSCSDAHEGVEIPLLAADTLLLCDQDKALVWTVLRPTDTEARLAYSLCAGMMGRMQLSGDLEQLNDQQMAFTKKCIDFYGSISLPVRRGELTINRQTQNRTRPQGTQTVMLAADREMLVIVHFFQTDESEIIIELPADDWKIADYVSPTQTSVSVAGTQMLLKQMSPFSAAAIQLVR